MEIHEAVERVCALAQHYCDSERIARARQRQSKTFTWDVNDYLPILFSVKVPELDDLPEYNWHEQWYDPAKSFVMQMKGAVAQAAAVADNVPGIRADLGVVIAASIFGVGFQVPEHTKPVVDRFLSKETLREFVVPEDISCYGVIPRLIEHTEYHQSTLRCHGLSGLIDVYHCDTQGPFDIACLAFGHDIFYEIYDDPEFVHQLMTQATRAYLALTRYCKKLQGESETRGNAAGLWMERGGVRVCDDSGILLTRESFAEFVLPYLKQALAPFGGGWLHYCGGVPEGGRSEGIHLHDHYFQIPGLRGLNFTTGKDWEAEIRNCIAHNIAYVGWLPLHNGELLDAYFTRIVALAPKQKGIILQCYNNALSPDEFKDAQSSWQNAQDLVRECKLCVIS